MEIPGYMSRGNWTAGLFVDERASIYATKAFQKIFTGKAGGTTGLLSILVGNFLGIRHEPIHYDVEDETRVIKIPKIIDGRVNPIKGKEAGEHTVIRNSEYWIAEDIIVAQSERSRLRAFGRNWNFEGRSAEICELNWHN